MMEDSPEEYIEWGRMGPQGGTYLKGDELQELVCRAEWDSTIQVNQRRLRQRNNFKLSLTLYGEGSPGVNVSITETRNGIEGGTGEEN